MFVLHLSYVLCFLKLRATFNLAGPWKEASSTNLLVLSEYGMVMTEASCAPS